MLDFKKVTVNLGDASDFLFYDIGKDSVRIHSKEFVLTGRHIGNYLIIVQNRGSDTALTSYLYELTVNCV